MFSEQLNSLSGVDFEHLCATLISGMGFQVEVTKASGDGGIDIIANSSTPLYKGRYIIQCKRYAGTVGEPILRDLYGVVMSERANKGILMTTGTFTRSAIAFAEGKPLELIDISGIQSLIAQTEYKASVVSQAISVEEIKVILDKGLDNFSYCDLQEELANSPNNLTIRGKLGLLLFGEATDSINFSDYTIEERRTLLCAVLYYLEPFKRKGIEATKDNSAKLKTFVYFWCCAQSAFLLGNYAEAEQYYQHIFGWNDLLNSVSKDNGLINCLYCLIIELVSFYALTGNSSKANYLLQHPAYKQILQMKKESLLSSINKTNSPAKAAYWTSLVSDLENIVTAPNFHLLEINDRKLFGEDILFDKSTKTYNPNSINVLAPTLCKVQLVDREIRIITDGGELLMSILP